MNTLRYKSEYYGQTVDILKNLPNMVDLPSDIFFDIARLSENGEPDKIKFEKFIKKTFTVLAIEDENVIGLAGMDNEGNIGLFIVRECDGYAKACRLLSNALERRATKKELPYLFVLQTEESEQTFLDLGYAPFDNGSGAANDAILAKQIEPENKIDIKSEQVKEIKLNPSKKITVEGKTSIFPAFLLGLASFFAFLLIAITAGKLYAGTFSDVSSSSYTPIAVFVGVFFTAAVTLFIAYIVRGKRLKKEVLSMRVTNGVILSLTANHNWNSDDDTTRSGYSYVSLTYAYYDENMQRKEAHYRHRYRFDSPYFYEGQELVIAHSGEKSYILHSFSLISSQSVEAETKTVMPEPLDEGELSHYVPLNAVKRYYSNALCFFIAAALISVFLLVFNILVVIQTGRPFFDVLQFAFAVPVILILLVPCVISLAIPAAAKKKYKALINNKGAMVTEGKLVYSSGTYKSDNKFRFYCEYSDGYENKKIAVPKSYAQHMVRAGKTSVKVIFDTQTAIVLVKRGVYPDEFTFRLR